MKIRYPICFYPYENGDKGYKVEVPDLPGCESEGSTIAEAILNIREVGYEYIKKWIKRGKALPDATDIETLNPDRGGFVSVICIEIFHKYSSRRDEPMTQNKELYVLLDSIIKFLELGNNKRGLEAIQDTLDIYGEEIFGENMID